VRILITGASGLLGVNLALEAALALPGTQSGCPSGCPAESHTVFGVVNKRKLHTREFEKKGICLIQADLLEPGAVERVLRQTRPEWIIHCAALALVDQCEADPERARKLNSELPVRLAEMALSPVARGGARFLHISTDAVFDGVKGEYSEEDDPNPLSVYARTKLDGEKGVLQVNPDALVTRVNMVGWSLSGKRSLAEFFYNHLSASKQVNGFTDVFFCPLLANQLAKILIETLSLGLSGLFHIVSSECISKYEFGIRLAKRFHLDENLITPIHVSESSLLASRGTKLNLRTEKISSAVGRRMPGINECIDGLYELHRQGFPQMLRILTG